MHRPVRTCKSVDIELELPACTDHPQAAPAPRRGNGFARQAVAGAVLAAIAGCATHDTNPARQFRVEPVLRMSNAVPSTEASQAYCTLGRYFDGLHEWSRAADAWRQAVAADNRNVEALDGLGVALAQGRGFAEAEAALRQAVALAPERARIRNNLGYVLLLAGRPQDAMAEFKRAVSLDGGYAIAQANLREAMLRSGVQPDTALASAVTPAAAPADAPPPAREAPVDPTPTVAATGTQAEHGEPPAPASTDVTTAASVTATATAETEKAATTPAAPEATATALSTSTPAPEAATLAVLQRSRLEVSNGNGINGMAARVGSWLAAHGVPTARLTNQQPYDQRLTMIQFRVGHEEAARRLASLLPAGAQTASQASPELRSDIRLVLGRDWVPVAQCLARASCQPPAPGTATTVAEAVAQR